MPHRVVIDPPRVVITGLGVICAIGRDPDEFWLRLASGTGGISLITDPAFAAFEARHPDVRWYVYPGAHHGFDNDTRPARHGRGVVLGPARRATRHHPGLPRRGRPGRLRQHAAGAMTTASSRAIGISSSRR